VARESMGAAGHVVAREPSERVSGCARAPCAETVGMAQWSGAEFASGCALPRDVSLLSDCIAESPQTQAQPYVAVPPLHAHACASGPNSNTGLASNREPRR
jgi:hypothetical protein